MYGSLLVGHDPTNPREGTLHADDKERFWCRIIVLWRMFWHRPDWPLINERASAAFVTGAGYEQLRSAPRRADWQVLPVAAVQRPRSRGETLGYYADVVVQSALSRRARDFLDLRGANWATNKETSLSGHLVVLELLRRKGESVSFFGNILGRSERDRSFMTLLAFLSQSEPVLVQSRSLPTLVCFSTLDWFIMTSLAILSQSEPVLVQSRSLPTSARFSTLDWCLMTSLECGSQSERTNWRLAS